MAIIDVRRLRRLQLSETSTANGAKTLAGSEELLIVSDDATTTFYDVATNTGVWSKIGGTIPRVGDSTTFAGQTLNVTSRKFAYTDEENDRLITLTVNYESKEATEEEDQEDPEPWLNISIQSVTSTMPATGWEELSDVPDYDESDEGSPAVNSAKEAVDGITEEVSMVKLVYTNTLATSPDFPALLSYANTCNKSTYLGCPNYTLKVNGYSADYDQKNSIWSVSVEFLFNPKGWQIKYYDVGFNEDVSGERRAIVDKAGNPVSKPVPLDGSGQALPIGSDPIERSLYPYKVADFTDLFTNCGI
jgi:hypothetical protein